MTQTTPWTLHRTEVSGGTYRGLLTCDDAGQTAPALSLELGGQTLSQMMVTQVDGGWQVEGAMGLAPLTDGTQTVFVRLPDGTALDSLTVVTGLNAPEDLRAELSALRAELEVFKVAFRRHVSES